MYEKVGPLGHCKISNKNHVNHAMRTNAMSKERILFDLKSYGSEKGRKFF